MGMVLALAAHAVVALLVGLTGRRLRRRALVVGAIAPAVAFAVAVLATPAVLAGDAQRVSVPWVPGMDLTLTLSLDGFALLFWWIIAGIGVLVLLYAARYFGDRDDLGRFTAVLVTFAGAMLLLTAADDVYLLYVAWEITSITSYLLIGFKDQDTASRASALQALLVTGAGGLAMLGGLVLVSQAADTSSLSTILAAPPSGTGVEVGLVLVLLGAMTKSAQVPFHFWLPGAMAAPTPVSAYLHSATMVKAGIYLLARFAPAFGPEVAWWPPVLLAVGGTTMLLGGWRALQSHDLKELLAFGTVSQLGFIVLLVGTGDPELLFAGLAVLVAHSLFKATLFLSVGVVDHQAHTRDLRKLDGVGRAMPVTAVAATVAVASMAGLIPLFGFVAKESALEGALHAPTLSVLTVGLVTVGAMLTTAYGLRFVRGAFLRKRADELRDGAVGAGDVPRPSRGFEAPGALLALLTLVFGLWVAPVDALVVAASGALVPDIETFHLRLWHGFGTSLLLSTVALAGGVALWRLPRLVGAMAARTGRVPEARDAYRGSLRGLLEFADRTVAVVQPGSLPVYLGVILVTVLVLPGSALVRGVTLGVTGVAGTPVQALMGALVIAAALGAAVVRTRLSSVLLLGAVGYGVAVLFVLQGAPDLALTQLLIETMSLGIFVLVLRRLPDEFVQPGWRLGTGLRVVLSVAVGGLMSVLAIAATTARTEPTAAAEFLARAEPEGGGKNVVNVILTDFRALDTLGEVTVLVVAAVGVLSIVRATWGDAGPDDAQAEPADPTAPTAGAGTDGEGQA